MLALRNFTLAPAFPAPCTLATEFGQARNHFAFGLWSPGPRGFCGPWTPDLDPSPLEGRALDLGPRILMHLAQRCIQFQALESDHVMNLGFLVSFSRA